MVDVLTPEADAAGNSHARYSTHSTVLIAARMLLLKDAARYCGLSRVYFLRACPIEPTYFLGRIRRYDCLALDKWLDSLKRKPADLDLVAEWKYGRNRRAR